MDRVPIDVLNEIFITLDIKDRLECMPVCRRWYGVLDELSLLHTLFISNNNQFAELQAMITRQPHRANQVKFLTLYSNSYHGFDKRVLCNMFPNLRQVILRHSGNSYNKTNYLDIPFQFTHATVKLEKIVDFGECELTCQLARSNMCSNLNFLDLHLDLHRNVMSRHILPQIKNMPFLETLILRYLRLRLMDLEMVHDNLPSLKRLRIMYTTLLSGELPQDVTPANLITEADLELNHYSSASDLDTHVQFYKYIAKKYPSVTQPNYDKNVALFRADDSYIRTLYNEGILPLYQHIGSRIDAFHFERYCDGLDAFRKFDRFGMKLKELTVKYVNMSENWRESWREGSDEDVGDCRFRLDELAQSQQSKSIQKLILNDIIPKPLEMMMNIEALTYLEISFSDSYAEYNEKFTSTINFDQLVDACPPTLTNLTIDGMHLDSGKLPTNVTSIQNLKFVTVKIAEGGVELAERNFPELTILNVEAIIKSKLTISLPNHHLKQADIEVQYPEYAECYISVNTMVEGKFQCNKVWPGYKHPLYGMQRHCPRKVDHGFMEIELVDFTCASVEKSSYFIYHKNNGDEECYDDEYY